MSITMEAKNWMQYPNKRGEARISSLDRARKLWFPFLSRIRDDFNRTTFLELLRRWDADPVVLADVFRPLPSIPISLVVADSELVIDRNRGVLFRGVTVSLKVMRVGISLDSAGEVKASIGRSNVSWNNEKQWFRENVCVASCRRKTIFSFGFQRKPFQDINIRTILP